MLRYALDPFPMSELHRFAAHQLQKGTDFIEIVDGLLEGKEGWPLLQRLWEFATPNQQVNMKIVCGTT